MSVLIIFMLSVALGAAVLVGIAILLIRPWRERAVRAGYPSLMDYLRAAPRTDRDRREAVDLTLQGLVLCVLGLLFPPFLLMGLFPLYFGARKIAFSSMGLGLVDDADADV